MAFLGETFDINTLPQSESTFDPIPAGWYTATILEADVRDTRSGAGRYLKLRFDILGPTHQGRAVFGNVTIRHQNMRAEEIGRRQLGELIRAAGLSVVRDSDELVGRVVRIRVAVRHDDGYDPANEVRAFKPASNPPPPHATASDESFGNDGVTPPWAR